jgi:hypothetical protein
MSKVYGFNVSIKYVKHNNFASTYSIPLDLKNIGGEDLTHKLEYVVPLLVISYRL